MRVTIRLFARLRDAAGRATLERPIAAEATVRTVWEGLVADYPQLAPFERSISCARNAEFARMTTMVVDGDEIAFLPPVSGG